MKKAGRMFYTEEKTLYFASQRQGLHVQPKESKIFSDLSGLVADGVEAGHLVKVADDDSGDYYKTTPAGDIRLLELQIEWRESHRRDAGEQRRQLEALRKGHANP
jgi:DNA-binding PadR family transcriptional regulator